MVPYFIMSYTALLKGRAGASFQLLGDWLAGHSNIGDRCGGYKEDTGKVHILAAACLTTWNLLDHCILHSTPTLT
jgi:hypothetical protein